MNSFLITCSHATCAIPEPQRELFKNSTDLVTSEKGWEPGALNLAQGLAMKLSTPLIHGEVSRLLIDLEQSGEERWSEVSAGLPDNTKKRVAERHEDKFRHLIEVRVLEDLKRYDFITHLAIHTAPIADGEIIVEHGSSEIATELAKKIVGSLPDREVTAICRPLEEKTPLMKWVSELCPEGRYDNLRLTVSQSFFLRSVPMRWETIKRALIKAVDSAAK